MKKVDPVRNTVKFVMAKGTLDARSMPQFESEVTAAVGPGVTRVVLHLARVRRIDTHGLSMLLAVIAAVRRQGVAVTIIGFSDSVDTLVSVKLLTVVDVIASEAAIIGCLCAEPETNLQLDADRTAA